MREIAIYVNEIYVTTVYVDKELDYDAAVEEASKHVFYDVIADDI